MPNKKTFDPTGTIPGWKTAIFYDVQGRPYWRSDGLSLSAPQPETSGEAIQEFSGNTSETDFRFTKVDTIIGIIVLIGAIAMLFAI